MSKIQHNTKSVGRQKKVKLAVDAAAQIATKVGQRDYRGDNFWSKLRIAAGDSWNWFKDKGWLTILQSGAALLDEPGIRASLAEGVIPAGTVMKIVPLSPQSMDGTNLKVKAGLFARYRFVNSHIEVRGLTGSVAATGAVAVFINPDPGTIISAADRNSVENAVQSFGGSVCRLDRVTSIKLPGADEPLHTQNGDPRLSQQGVVYIVAYTDLSLDDVAFDIVFRYDIELAQDIGSSTTTPSVCSSARFLFNADAPVYVPVAASGTPSEELIMHPKPRQSTGAPFIDADTVVRPGIYMFTLRGFHNYSCTDAGTSGSLQACTVSIVLAPTDASAVLTYSYSENVPWSPDAWRQTGHSFVDVRYVEVLKPSSIRLSARTALYFYNGNEPKLQQYKYTLNGCEMFITPLVAYGGPGPIAPVLRSHMTHGLYDHDESYSVMPLADNPAPKNWNPAIIAAKKLLKESGEMPAP